MPQSHDWILGHIANSEQSLQNTYAKKDHF